MASDVFFSSLFLCFMFASHFFGRLRWLFLVLYLNMCGIFFFLRIRTNIQHNTSQGEFPIRTMARCDVFMFVRVYAMRRTFSTVQYWESRKDEIIPHTIWNIFFQNGPMRRRKTCLRKKRYLLFIPSSSWNCVWTNQLATKLKLMFGPNDIRLAENRLLSAPQDSSTIKNKNSHAKFFLAGKIYSCLEYFLKWKCSPSKSI